MKHEIPINQIIPLNQCTIRKGISNGRPAFIMDVEYRLADGRTLHGTIGEDRKKDVSGALARAQQCAAANSMFACFDDNGAYFGTTQKWTFGAGGLVPTNDL